MVFGEDIGHPYLMTETFSAKEFVLNGTHHDGNEKRFNIKIYRSFCSAVKVL